MSFAKSPGVFFTGTTFSPSPHLLLHLFIHRGHPATDLVVCALPETIGIFPWPFDSSWPTDTPAALLPSSFAIRVRQVAIEKQPLKKPFS